MNPLIIFVALAVGFMIWVLVVSLRRGEFSYRSRGRMGVQSVARVKKSESPRLFWGLAAIHAAIILYIASFVFQLE